MKKVIVIVILLLLFIVAGVGFLQRDKLETTAKGWRAQTLLKKAKTAQSEGDVEVARKLATTSYYMKPGLEPLRVLLQSKDPRNAKVTARVANAIFFHPDATAKDRAECLDIFLPSRNQRMLKQLFDNIPQEDYQDPEIKYRQARFLATFGRPGDALQLLEGGPEDDFRFNFFKTAIRCLATAKEMRTQGQKELVDLITSDDEKQSNQAFNYMRGIPMGLRESSILRPAAEQWISKQPEKRAADELVLYSFDWLEAGGMNALRYDQLTRQIEASNSDADREKLIEQKAQWAKEKQASDKVAKRVASKLGDENPALIANWLNSIRLWQDGNNIAKKGYQNLNEATGQDQIKKYLLYQIQLQSLEATQNWTGMKALLANPPKDFSSMRTAMLRAITAQRMGEKTLAAKSWQEAWKYAELDSALRNSYLDLYQHARKAGEADLAVRAMLEASKHRFGLMPPADELTLFMVYLSQTNRNAELLEFTDNLFSRPEAFGIPVYNNLIYLRELLGAPIADASERTDTHITKSPKTVGLKTTKILILINQKKYDEAYNIAEKVISEGSLDQLQPSEIVLLAAAYKFAGKEYQSEEADFDIHKKIDRSLAIEQKQFRKWFKPPSKP